MFLSRKPKSALLVLFLKISLILKLFLLFILFQRLN